MELTKNKIDNILVYVMLMQEFHITEIGYIKEKYNTLFNSLPDKEPIIDDEKHYNEVYSSYIRRWNFCNDLSDDEIRIFKFTYQLSIIKICSFKNMTHVFKSNFRTYKSISNNYNVNLLHELLRGHIDEFYKVDKDASRLLKIFNLNDKIVN